MGVVLSDQDCAVLIEALDCWIEKDAASDMLLTMFAGTLKSGRPQDEHVIEEQLQAVKAEQQEKKKIRKERAVLLQAKLIQIRDMLAVDKLCSGD